MTFFRSGDRGFILDGQVFLIGRIKSVLIFQGRNYEPSDIEYAVWGCHPNLRPGCCAALSIPDDELGTDVLVMIAEVNNNNDENKKNKNRKNKIVGKFYLIFLLLLRFGMKTFHQMGSNRQPSKCEKSLQV